MRRIGIWAMVSGAAILAAATTACADTTSPLLSAEEAGRLVAAAQEMSVASLLDELELDPSQRTEVEAKLGVLHASMLDLHDQQQPNMDGLTPEQMAALHDRLQSGMEGLHEQHQVLMESLTEDQRGRFMEHVHTFLQEHHGGSADLHERHLLPRH